MGPTIAIIGTAGRKEDGDRLDKAIFSRMLMTTKTIIESIILSEPTITGNDKRLFYNLVSGGAAWSDHIAVILFLHGDVEKLDLELPCPIVSCGRYLDNGGSDFKTNPGRTSNYYHELFSKKISLNSFNHLNAVIGNPNCKVTIGDGFFERNSEIARKADHCIALTFGDGATLKDGGTADTMKKFLKKGTGQSFHVDLNDMKVYSPAIVN